MINVDWLQINLRNSGERPISPEDIKAPYRLVDTGKRTPVFAKLWEIWHDEKLIAYGTSEPYMKELDYQMFIVKFQNEVLYQSNLKEYVEKFLDHNNLHFRSYTRLDLAYDFNHFSNGLHARQFLELYFNRSIKKTDKTKTSILANDGDLLDVQYIKWGTPQSDLSYYLYNKTLELKEQKNKPYIQDLWEKNGLNKFDVWRMEFRIMSNQKLFIDSFSGEYKTLNEWGLELLEQKNLLDVYNALFSKYMDFRIDKGQKKITDMEKFILFNEFKIYKYVIKDMPKKEVTPRMVKTFVKYMCFQEDWIQRNIPNAEKLGFSLKNHIRLEIGRNNLLDWARKKEFVPLEAIPQVQFQEDFIKLPTELEQLQKLAS